VHDPEFWTRVDAVFTAAVELEGDAAGRAALVEDRCAGDAALLAEVRSLLAAHERSGGFLAAADGPGSVAPTGLGTIVGAYRLTARIGEGGMGDVYRAERADGLFGHAVALKVTRGSVVEPATAGRFRTERQILASLQHPHIVTLLDGGTMADGRAYLVMELVDGEPITAWCARRGLGLEARLALFRQVCAAAHHAHRHAIVHRDLKPANVLVTTDGVPKVLDFGVAKLLEAAPGGDQTVPGLLPGPLTPNYASPEQLRGLPVTTASDVYALGVLLYELLTGARPYETTGQPLDRVIDLVVRTEPTRPSEVPPPASAAVPWDRRRLRGDLDAIVLKALAKEPEARYASAEQLADDVGRFAAGQPVSAREPSAVYLLRKLAARHRVAVVAVGLALAGVLTGFGVALWQRNEAERERRLAEARLADVRALANTLIFKIHDAIVPLQGSTPVRRTIVDEALAYLERVQRESEHDLRLRFELAGAYQRVAMVLGYPQAANLGDRPGALKAMQQAERLIAAQALHPDAPLDTIDRYIAIERQLATIYRALSRDEEARRASQAALQRAEQLVARDGRLARGRELLAHALFDQALDTTDPAAAIAIWTRAGGLYEGLLAERPDDKDQLRNVALVEKYVGARAELLKDLPRAARHYQRALAFGERRLALTPDDPQSRLDTAIDLANVAAVREREQDFEGAVLLRRRSTDIRRALAVADPQNVYVRGRLAFSLALLARSEAMVGRLDDASGNVLEGVALARAVVAQSPGRDSRQTLADTLEAQGVVEAAWGRRDASCRAYREALALYEENDAAETSFGRTGARAGWAHCAGGVASR
jgi:tetratricopeptide (TPR) repeat protein